jgi:hypothetical protein
MSGAYGVQIVRPIGRFRPRSEAAVPKSSEPVRWRYDCTLKKEHAERCARAYNGWALAHGWRTWAVVRFDAGFSSFLEACEATSKKCRDLFGVYVHGLKAYDNGAHEVSLSVHVPGATLRDGESILACAVRGLRAHLRQIEKLAAAEHAEPVLKLHRARKAGAA